MARSFSVRGVVEGFYGRPWSPDERQHAVSFLADRGGNAYVYAPKDDPWHRARWRDPYPDAELDALRRLARHCSGSGVRLGFGISPGLDIDYRSPADIATLVAKFTLLADAGVGWFLLLLDDIPMRPGLAADQAELAEALRAELGTGDDVHLTICPTEYLGTTPSAYLGELGAGLPDPTEVMWTGPTVCSPVITAEDAGQWVAALGDHPVVLWDNTPVNDATMTHALHLGPYTGRDPDLVGLLHGILCNPMTQSRASLVQLATAMAFLRDPDGYDPEREWAEAIAAVGGSRAPSLTTLARACADGPLAPPDDLALARMVDHLATDLTGPDWADAACGLAEELRAARTLANAFAGSDPLDEEVAPWAEAASREARAGLAAVRLVQALRPAGGAPGVESDVGPERALELVYGLIARWSGLRMSPVTVFGPRFAVYSAVRRRTDGAPILDVDAAIREDGNAVDRLCRLALADYARWTSGTAPEAFSTRLGAALPFTPTTESRP